MSSLQKEVNELARPITETKSETRESDRTDLTNENKENTCGHHDDSGNIAGLIESMEENGLLEFLDGIARNYKHTVELITDEMSRESNRRFLTNALSIYTLLSSIDPDRLTSFVRNVASSFNAADDAREKGSVGILSLLSEMKDRDVSAGIRILLSIMKGFTSEKKDRD